MKALIVVENSPVPLDIRVWQQAITLRDAGWSVTVICPEDIQVQKEKSTIISTKKPENLEGVTIFRFPLSFAEKGMVSYLVEYLSAFISISRLCWQVWQRDHFDIIQFCNPPDIFFPIAMFYRMLGASVIFDQHDLFPEFVSWRYSGVTGKLLSVAAQVTEFLTFRSANIVLSTNESYRRIAIKRGKVSGEKVFIVRNGPKQDLFFPVEPDPCLKRGFPYLACYAGVMGHGDGVLELLDSLYYIIHDLGRRDILFILLGDGAVHSQAEQQVAAWGMQDFIIMPGMIRDKLLLRQYLCTADVLLSPEPLNPLNNCSTFIKVAEYMAMGKPIIAYYLQETRYTAQEAALYVKPGDTRAFGQAIVSLLNNPELREKMGIVGRERIQEKFCWEKQQHNLLQAYKMALEQDKFMISHWTKRS